MKHLSLLQKFWLMAGMVALAIVMEVALILWKTHSITMAADSLNRVYLPLLGHAQRLKFAVIQVQQFLSDVSATRGQDGLDDGWTRAEEFAL